MKNDVRKKKYPYETSTWRLLGLFLFAGGAKHGGKALRVVVVVAGGDGGVPVIDVIVVSEGVASNLF